MQEGHEPILKHPNYKLARTGTWPGFRVQRADGGNDLSIIYGDDIPRHGIRGMPQTLSRWIPSYAL